MKYYKKFTCIVFAFLSLFLSQLCYALGTGFDVHQESRVISDTSQINLGMINQQSDQPWVVAIIEPSSNSGRLEGFEKDPKNGNLIRNPDIDVGQILDGSVIVSETLTKDPFKSTWDYKLKKSGRFNGMLVGLPIGAFDLFTPFERKNTIICRVREVNRDGNAAQQENYIPFSPLYVIPNEWRNFVLPALKIRQEKAAPFDLTDNQSRQQLQDLINSDNPFISIEAYGTLVSLGLSDQKFFEGALLRSSNYKQSILVCISLLFGQEKDFLMFSNVINKFIEMAKNSSELKQIALGVYAARIAPQRSNLQLSQQTSMLLQKIFEQQKMLGEHSVNNDQLSLILRWSGTDKSSPLRPIISPTPK